LNSALIFTVQDCKLTSFHFAVVKKLIGSYHIVALHSTTSANSRQPSPANALRITANALLSNSSLSGHQIRKVVRADLLTLLCSNLSFLLQLNQQTYFDINSYRNANHISSELRNTDRNCREHTNREEDNLKIGRKFLLLFLNIHVIQLNCYTGHKF